MADMSEDGALFDLPPAGGPPVALPEPMSADRRRTLRQAETIKVGGHPLYLATPPIFRHPATIGGDYARDDKPGRELTCGTCVHRQAQGSHGRSYPKCDAQDGTRISSGAGTDVRAWWPACTLWTPGTDA
jgi:hypothetical protein